MKKVYKGCFLNKCVQFNNGVLYKCTRVRLLEDQKICKHNENEIIEVNKIKNKREMKKRVKKFYSLKYLAACNYCNSDDLLVEIPIGEQLED